MKRSVNGFGLVELMLSVGIGAALTLSFVQLVSAGMAASRLQQELAGLQETARFAIASIEGTTRAAGFTHQPWISPGAAPAIDLATAHAISQQGDRLATNQLSNTNCYGNLNPITDVSGAAEYFQLHNSFWVSTDKRLVRRCTYGPVGGSAVVQINNNSLAEPVEYLALQFAEDLDHDGIADGWVRAGQWQATSRLLGVRLGLLVASHDPLLPAASTQLTVLDRAVSVPADRLLRQVFQASWPFEGALL